MGLIDLASTVFKTLVLAVFILEPVKCQQSPSDTPSVNNEQQQPQIKSPLDLVKLPKHVNPIHYRILLVPLLQDSVVLGSVKIQLVALQSVSAISLNMKDIALHKAAIKELSTPTSFTTDSNPLSITNQLEDRSRDFYSTFMLNKPLTVGQHYSLDLEFSSLIRNDLTGFYKSTYVEERQGQRTERTVGVTQAAPINTRTIFPCFDQPDFKSTFEISIARDSFSKYTVISNMEKISTEQLPISAQRVLQQRTSNLPGAEQIQWQNWVWDNFKNSLPMPTYLLAFVISEFQYQETYISSRSVRTGQQVVKPLRVWSRPDLANQTKFALRIAPKLVEFYEDYLGIDYPLEKLDLVAVPDFDQGAMENFGLLTFRENLMLVEPDCTNSMRDIIASTIAHSISHQWFGDLVTMSWWSDFWLNEGIATYLEYLGVNHVEPSWNKMPRFLSREVYEMLDLDALATSHPTSMHVNNPGALPKIFDSISYSKGAIVIRMLANLIGEKTFQRGLNRYLNKLKFSNSRTDDFWTAMTDQALADGVSLGNVGGVPLSIGEIMNGWTNEAGFPVVQVQREYIENGRVQFTQKQFNLDSNSNELTQLTNNNGKKWLVPISFATPTVNSNFQDLKPRFWLLAKKSAYTLNQRDMNLNPNDWLIVNVKQTGLYRVNYDTQNWKLLIAQLHTNPNAISIENRGQLINDAWNLARASMLTYDYAFNLSNYLRFNEQEFLPWQAFKNTMDFMYNMYSRLPAEFGHFKTYLRSVVQNQLGTTGFLDRTFDSTPKKDTRSVLNHLACIADNRDCILIAAKLFRAWMTTPEQNPIPLNHRKEIYCTAMKYGDISEWNFLLEQYVRSQVTSDKKTILNGLTCSHNKVLLQRLLNIAMDVSQNLLNKVDAGNVITQIAANPVGSNMVLNLLNDKWLQVSSHIPSVNNVIEVIGNQLNTKLELAMMEEFVFNHKNHLGTSTRSIAQALEKIALNSQWMDKFSGQVSEFMKKYK